MSGRAKVCRVETVSGAKLAAHAGAEFIGLHVVCKDAETNSQLARHRQIVEFLRNSTPQCSAVLVTRSKDAAFVACAAVSTQAPLIQLHEALAFGFLEQLRKETRALGASAPPIIKTLTLSGTTAHVLKTASGWLDASFAILLDKSTMGGTGEQMDWRGAREIVAGVRHGRVLVAGGLGAENADRALDETGAWGVDAQSQLEKDTKISGRHMKDPLAVIGFVGASRGLMEETAVRQYRWRRAHPRVLVSLSELNAETRELFIEASIDAGSAFDGFQVDASDGSAGVPRDQWHMSPSEWASLLSVRSPEAPLWLHFFSKDDGWICDQISRVVEANAHLVGAFVQPAGLAGDVIKVWRRVQARVQLPVVPSLTVSQVEAGFDFGDDLLSHVQLTAPATGTPERATRSSSAIQQLRDKGLRVHLDRAITTQMIRGMSARPDGVTIGRGLADADFDAAIDSLAVSLDERT